MNLVAWATHEATSKLATALPRRWLHVQGVFQRAAIAQPLFSQSDGELLAAAAILHDIGYAPDLVRSGFHPLDGALFLNSIGAPEIVTQLVAYHSCALIEARVRHLTPDLNEFPIPPAPLLEALTWADMTTTPAGEATDAVSRIDEILERYSDNIVISTAINEAKDELLDCVARVEARLGQG
ncbi:MAG TPA: HD domain-containing protein [Pseudonocardiaceae bacterium]|jgi:hypothetical protein